MEESKQRQLEWERCSQQILARHHRITNPVRSRSHIPAHVFAHIHAQTVTYTLQIVLDKLAKSDLARLRLDTGEGAYDLTDFYFAIT